MSAYYATSAAPTVLSLHNLDSDRLRHSARSRRVGSPDWARLHHQARATAHVERQTSSLAPSGCCACRPRTPSAPPSWGPARSSPPTASTTSCSPSHRRPPDGGRCSSATSPTSRTGAASSASSDEGWPAARRLDSGRRAGDRRARDSTKRSPPSCAGTRACASSVRSSDVADAFAPASVVVVPIWEGGGVRIKVLEAMAAGRAIASTSFGVGRHGRT